MQTNVTDYIGNYTMSLTGTMRSYPVQTATINFKLNVTEFKNDQLTNVQVKKGTAPILQEPILSGNVPITFGAAWSYRFTPFDADNDLASINVKLGAASVFVEFNREKNELSIAQNNTAELTGRYPVAIELID